MRRIIGLSVIGFVGLALCVPLGAQDPTDAQKEVAALRLQIAAQAKQIAALEAKTKPAQMTRAERTVRDQEFYATAFVDARDRARKPCRDAGGKLWVMVSQGQSTTVSVSCEF